MKWKVKKLKCIAFILTLTLMFSTANFLVVQQVSPMPSNVRIRLPFDTSWEQEEGQAWGKYNTVYGIQSFSNPTLERITNEEPPPEDDEVYGYNFGDYQLKAAGSFDSSYSYCYFTLFDTTSECDGQLPFKIRQHTFISLFYCHKFQPYCMIDAQLYNKITREYSTLRDFQYNGNYIVDQNDTRLHPACRGDDPLNSWEYVSFDLSIIYEKDPENWYVTQIWIAFDNNPNLTGKSVTGQATTYFDMLHITYGIADKETQIENEPYTQRNAWICAGMEAWEHQYAQGGDYRLWLKATVSAFDDGYFLMLPYQCSIYPYVLKVSSTVNGAHGEPYPKPTGVNLTEIDEDLLPPENIELVLDTMFLIVGYIYPGLGMFMEAVALAGDFLALAKTALEEPPPGEPIYEWPHADWGPIGPFGYIQWADWDPKNNILGEVYICIPGLDEGPHSFQFTFTVDYYFAEPGMQMVNPAQYEESLSVTLNFDWSTVYDDLNVPPEDPLKPSGPTEDLVWRWLYYSTSTTDPEEERIRYDFNWGDDSNTTTGYYYSGESATVGHRWTAVGMYTVTVKAQDESGLWSGLSPPLQVHIIYGGGSGSCPFIYSWDGQQYRFDHEAYPFAVMKSAETTSYDRLRYLKEVDGEYWLKIEQVLHETDWTDSFELYVVDHPDEDSFVMPDLQGNLHTIKELVQPVSAYEKNGDECLEDVKYLDDRTWKDSIFDADVNDESTLRNWIVLTFPKPEGTTEAKFMLSVKKQITITQEWEFFINVIGENYWNLWQKIMENPILTELYLDMYEREISLRIEVWNGTEWVLQDSISAGDALWDDFLAVLDISDIEGDELQIRLKSTTAHYEINYVGIDYSEDEPMIANKIDPYYAVKNGEEDVSAALERPDENYVTLFPNDVIELRYEAIPESEWKRDFTIATKGYYNFVDFQDQTFSGFLKGITLWLKGLTEPYFVAKTVFPYLQESQ